MGTFIAVMTVAFVIMLALPFVVYLSVKLGTYAYFKGKQIFERENDGETKKRATTGIGKVPGRDAPNGRR